MWKIPDEFAGLRELEGGDALLLVHRSGSHSAQDGGVGVAAKGLLQQEGQLAVSVGDVVCCTRSCTANCKTRTYNI